MGLEQLLAALGGDLRQRRHVGAFLAGREREPALADHPTLTSVLRALDDARPETYPARDALLRALLAEHQRGASSVWAAALLVAFAPMLRVLRARLRGSAFSADELDQLVVFGFVEALGRCPVGAGSVCLRLRLDTHRYVMRALSGEQRERREHRALEERARGDEHFVFVGWRTRPDELDDEERGELEALLRALVGDELVAGSVSEARLAVVIATRIRGEPLSDYLARTAAGRPTDPRAYQRIKRERSRTLTVLRLLLTTRLSPTDGALALDLSRLREAS